MKKILVVGGNGALGKAIIKQFRPEYTTVSLDLVANPDSTHSLVLDPNWLADSTQQVSSLKAQLNAVAPEFDAVVCVAGAWAGGNVASPTLVQEMLDMFTMNTMSSVLASSLASDVLAPEGLLVFTGAALPFKEPTPEMLAYNLSKTATHSLAINLAQSDQLPAQASVVTILPDVIDTENNRAGMPTADFATWVKPDSLSGLLKMWADGNNRPKNGSFALIKVEKGMAVPEFI